MVVLLSLLLQTGPSRPQLPERWKRGTSDVRCKSLRISKKKCRASYDRWGGKVSGYSIGSKETGSFCFGAEQASFLPFSKSVSLLHGSALAGLHHISTVQAFSRPLKGVCNRLWMGVRSGVSQHRTSEQEVVDNEPSTIMSHPVVKVDALLAR